MVVQVLLLKTRKNEGKSVTYLITRVPWEFFKIWGLNRYLTGNIYTETIQAFTLLKIHRIIDGLPLNCLPFLCHNVSRTTFLPWPSLAQLRCKYLEGPYKALSCILEVYPWLQCPTWIRSNISCEWKFIIIIIIIIIIIYYIYIDHKIFQTSGLLLQRVWALQRNHKRRKCHLW